MKICEECKKMFEDYEDFCPDCGTVLKNVEIVEKEKNNTGKIFGFSCLGCLGCLGLIFLFHIIFFVVLFNLMTVHTADYKYNDLRGKDAEKIVKIKLKKVDDLATNVVERAFVEQRVVNQYSTPTEVIENVFLQHPTNSFRIYDDGFTNPSVCNEPALIDNDGNIYCITNWINDGNKCDLAGDYSCAPNYDTPNLYVDINGATGPNMLTEKKKEMNDIFAFSIYTNRVKAKGITNKIYY